VSGGECHYETDGDCSNYKKYRFDVAARMTVKLTSGVPQPVHRGTHQWDDAAVDLTELSEFKPDHELVPLGI